MLCERSIVEKGTGQMSLIGLIEKAAIHLIAPGRSEPATEKDPGDVSEREPTMVPVPLGMELVNFWTRSDRDVPERGEMRTSLYGPNGEKIGKPTEPTAVDLEGQVVTRRTILKVSHFPYIGPGHYRIVISGRTKGAGRWRKYADVPLELAVKQEPPREDPEAAPE